MEQQGPDNPYTLPWNSTARPAGALGPETAPKPAWILESELANTRTGPEFPRAQQTPSPLHKLVQRVLVSSAIGVLAACSGSASEVELTLPQRLGAPRLDAQVHPTEATLENALTKARDEEHTKAVYVLRTGEPMGFDVQLPATPFGVSFELQALRRQVQDSEPTLRVELEWIGSEGRRETLKSDLQLKTKRGQRWVSFSADVEPGFPVQSLEWTLHNADSAALKKQEAFLLLRPQLERQTVLQERSKPATQVILITVDTLRADHLGAYGNKQVQSPHLDQLATESILYEDCYSVTNITNPSHASILTSLHLKDHQLRDNFTRFPNGVPTMVGEFSKRGLRTAAFVGSKNFEPGMTDFDLLFDEFFPCDGKQRRAEDVNADLLPWLAEHRNEDFFIWVHYYDVHGPYSPPYPYNTLYLPRRGAGRKIALEPELPTWYQVLELGEYTKPQYAGEVTYIDDQLGRVFDLCRQLKILPNAALAIVADHGESLGEHGVHSAHRGLYDEVTHVPWIFHPPGGAEGQRVEAMCSTLDIYPTLFDYLDLPISHPIRGRSMRPSDSGEITGGPAEELFIEHSHGAQVSMRTLEHAAILGLKDQDLTRFLQSKAGALELYHLRRDPKQQRDRAAADPEQAESMRAAMEAFLLDSMDLGIAGERIDNAQFSADMGDLGYIDSPESAPAEAQSD